LGHRSVAIITPAGCPLYWRLYPGAANVADADELEQAAGGGEGANAMAQNPEGMSKPGSGPGGLLGALGLPPKLLLLVALLALLVWWYFQTEGMTLTPTETAVVVLILAVVAAAGRATLNMVRRLRAPARGKPHGEQGGTAE
jgi:hypothetical protein